MTALARWNLGIAGRYETPIFLFWCALVLIAFTYVNSLWVERGLIVFEVAFVLAVAYGLRSVSMLRVEARGVGEAFRIAQAALASRVLSADAVRVIYMPVAWTFGELNFLAQRKVSLYSAFPTSLAGGQLLQHFTLSSGECPGEVRGVTWVHEDGWPGAVIIGRLRRPPSDGPLKWIIVTDEQQNIVGFGSGSQAARAVDNQRGIGGRRRYWIAFVPANAMKNNLFFYRVLGPGAVCAVNRSQTFLPLPTDDSLR